MTEVWRKGALILALSPLLFVVRAQDVKESFNVYTQRVDNQRSGVNLVEKQLNQSSVKTRFGKLWTLNSDAKVMAQPLYVSDLVSGKSTRD